jgi:hypothetical protein
MDVIDGFIGGIYNYCDRWCERCAFTSWCRLFADSAERDATRDPNLKMVANAPPLPEEVPPPPPRWMQEMIEELNRVSVAVSDEELRPPRPELDRDDHPVLLRAHSYFYRVRQWLDDHECAGADDTASPRAIVEWYSSMLPAKIGRALSGLAWAEPDDDDDPRDYEGSAKVALISLERSHAAWLQLAERGNASAVDVDLFVADLMWMTDALERVFPNARAFVRPAFDEPEAVAQLLADVERP